MGIVGEVIIEDSFFHVEPVSSPNFDDFHNNNPIIEKIGLTVSRTIGDKIERCCRRNYQKAGANRGEQRLCQNY